MQDGFFIIQKIRGMAEYGYPVKECDATAATQRFTAGYKKKNFIPGYSPLKLLMPTYLAGQLSSYVS